MAPRPMRPDDLYLLGTAGDPQLSADGTHLAWVQTRMDRETDKAQTSIWVAPVDGSEPPRAFTDGPSDHSPRWSPDGRWVAYVSITEEGKPGQLWLAPLRGGAPTAVTSHDGAVSQPAWSPDSTRIAYVTATDLPKPVAERTPVEKAAPRVVRGLAARLDNVGWQDGRRHVFVLDVASGETRQLTKGDWHDDMPAWSPDGSAVAFASDRDAGRDDRQAQTDAWVVASTGGRPRRLTRNWGRAAFPSFSPDGRKIAFIGHATAAGMWSGDQKLFVVDVDGGEPEQVAPHLDRPVTGPIAGPVAPFAWTGDGSLVFLVTDAGATGLRRAAPGGGDATVVVAGDRQVDGLSVGAEIVAFSVVWPDAPSEIYVAGFDGGDERMVSRVNDEFRAQIRLSPVQRSSVTTDDGWEIEYFLIRPPAAAKKRLPLHLEIHGGPHGVHPGGRHLANLQSVAAAGHLVLLPNPRGSMSYGQRFTEACVGDWGGRDYGDLMACVDDVVERGLADPEQLHVGGYSYGGFMTSWIVGHTDRFRSAVVGAPVLDQTSMLGTTDVHEFALHQLGGDPWRQAAVFAERSPLTYVPQVRTPVLIQHWEGDLRCPIGQSDELYAALTLHGVEVEYVRYPGGSHVSRTPSQAIDQVTRVIDWHARH